jgi:hypothetical protein
MKSFIVSRLLFELKKTKRIIFSHFWNIDETIDHWINHILDEITNFEIEFDNHSHVFVSIRLINWCRFIFFNNLNNESKHIKHKVNLVHIFDIQRFKSSFWVMLSFWLFEFIKFVDYKMHEKRYRFSVNREVSIIQKDDEWF